MMRISVRLFTGGKFGPTKTRKLLTICRLHGSAVTNPRDKIAFACAGISGGHAAAHPDRRLVLLSAHVEFAEVPRAQPRLHSLRESADSHLPSKDVGLLRPMLSPLARRRRRWAPRVRAHVARCGDPDFTVARQLRRRGKAGGWTGRAKFHFNPTVCCRTSDSPFTRRDYWPSRSSAPICRPLRAHAGTQNDGSPTGPPPSARPCGLES